MVDIHYADAVVTLNRGETVLDGLLRNGHAIPNGCRAGVCQACMMTAVDGNVPAAAQKSLRPAQIQNNAFLSCSCVPSESLNVALTPATNSYPAIALDKTVLNGNVIRLRLQTEMPYKAGQYCNLWKNTREFRTYSIASVKTLDSYIECHIKVLEKGAVSQWVFNELAIGDSISLQGPLGSCFYTQAFVDKPLILAGIGTGLAPLYGILRDALSQRHRGGIHLFIGARDTRGFYLPNALTTLAEQNVHFKVHFIAQQRHPGDSIFCASDALNHGNIYHYISEHKSVFNDAQAFLCGAPSFVAKMRKTLFLGGVPMKNIVADPFIAYHASSE